MVMAFYDGDEPEDPPKEIQFPLVDGNVEYEAYKEWLSLGNVPEPFQTPGEVANEQKIQEISDLKQDLRQTDHWLFRMILEVWAVGVAKGLWSITDITDQELRAKVQGWKTKLDRLEELGE
jgi:hypothetical protein